MSENNRIRSPKASERQKDELIKYFEERPSALRTINGSNTDNRAKQRIWIDLTHKLNTLDGALKTTSKWAKYWNDIIIYTKTRAKSFIQGENGCDRPPTEIERRLLMLVGHMSILKTWQQVWERGVKNQANQNVVMTKQDVIETKCVENVEIQSHHSSIDEYEIGEYHTLVIENTETLMDIQNASNEKMSAKSISSVTNEAGANNDGMRKPLVQSFSEQTANIFENLNNTQFASELVENIRMVGNSFSNIGTALNNIAGLIERMQEQTSS